jgi:hypothetical protein
MRLRGGATAAYGPESAQRGKCDWRIDTESSCYNPGDVAKRPRVWKGLLFATYHHVFDSINMNSGDESKKNISDDSLVSAVTTTGNKYNVANQTTVFA